MKPEGDVPFDWDDGLEIDYLFYFLFFLEARPAVGFGGVVLVCKGSYSTYTYLNFFYLQSFYKNTVLLRR
jgi:hypothetical protein